MKTLIRIQHNNGKGLFRALDTKGECILESLHCYEALDVLEVGITDIETGIL